jgi:hypothetical protein
LAQRLAERNAGVLDGVVLIDMEISLGADFDVDERMAGELLQHMIEEPDPGGDIGKASPIEIHPDLDVGFLGLACNGALAHDRIVPALLNLASSKPIDAWLSPALARHIDGLDLLASPDSYPPMRRIPGKNSASQTK